MKAKTLLFALCIALLLTNCGNAVGPSTQTPTVLHVTRPAVDNFPSLDTTIRDAKAVQHLYAAAYALAIPTGGGTVNCPSDNGMTYYLDFLKGTTSIQKMSLDATGCQYLQLSPSDSRYADTAFQSLFEKTVGIPSLVPEVSLILHNA